MDFRIGFGYDSHRLASGMPLLIGGINIPSEKGAVAHSDGDVLIHALCDAILGALAMGDIGTHFPDTDETYKGINGLELLSMVMDMCSGKDYRVGNIDATVVLQEPKIEPFVTSMRSALARACRCSINSISIKATTAEKMDAIGKGEGIAAYASVLIKSK